MIQTFEPASSFFARPCRGLLRSAPLWAALLLAGCGGGGDGEGGGVLPPPSPPTGPVAWSAPVALATNVTGAGAPAVAVEAGGQAAVLWSQTGLVLGSGQAPLAPPYLAARMNTAAGGWGALEFVDAAGGGDAVNDQITQLQALAPASGSAAAWLRATGAGNRPVSTRRQSSGWSPSNVAAPLGAARSDLALAANDAGVQVVAWSEPVDGVARIVAYQRQIGVGDWVPLPSVQVSPGVAGTQPALAVDADGRVMFVWREGTAESGQLRSRLYDPAVPGFGTQLAVDAALTDMRAPRVVAYGANQFLAVWEQANNNQYDLRAKRGNASNWQQASQAIDTRAESVGGARLLAGSDATALVAWQQGDAIYASRWAGATGTWTLPAQVAAAAGVGNLCAGMTPAGNAILAWTQPGSGGAADLYYATVTGGTPTASAATLLEVDAGAVSAPALAVNATGVAVVAWLRQVAGQAAPDLMARVAR